MGPRRTITSLMAAALVALAAPAVPTAVAAEPDTTPPAVSLDPYARPLVGSQVMTYYEGGSLEVWDAAFSLRWQADDASGICEQTVAWQGYENLGGDEDPVLGPAVGYTPVAASARSFVVGLDSFNWMRVLDRFYVRVTDCAGNTTASNIATSEFGTREDDAAGFRYKGRWRVGRLDGFDGHSGGTVHRTRTRSSVTTTFRGVGPVALVMASGPDNGRADVYVDGVRQATVDTYAPTARHRVVVWEGLYLGGTHTLRVVNKATRGHPSIEFDTLVLCETASCIGD